MTKGDATRRLILDAGVQLWAQGTDPTASAIGRRVGISQPAVYYHFPTGEVLREALACHAVQIGNSNVILQLAAIKHDALRAMPEADIFDHMRRVLL